MPVYLAADHRGFALKQQLKSYFPDYLDGGAFSLNPHDDYVDYATAVCHKLLSPEDRAILICGSGHGMDIVANRYSHIRAILGFNQDVVRQGRAHEDANVLVLASDWTDPVTAKTLIETFMSTPFSGEERHHRRLGKLASL